MIAATKRLPELVCSPFAVWLPSSCDVGLLTATRRLVCFINGFLLSQLRFIPSTTWGDWLLSHSSLGDYKNTTRPQLAWSERKWNYGKKGRPLVTSWLVFLVNSSWLIRPFDKAISTFPPSPRYLLLHPSIVLSSSPSTPLVPETDSTHPHNCKLMPVSGS